MRVALPLAAILLAACGQTGALYLPDEGVTTPVEIRTPAQAPTPAPAPEPEADDKDKKTTPPPGA